MDSTTLILAILPLVLLQLGLIALALRDLVDPTRRVRGDNKVIWAVVIVLGELFGPLAYFAVGRRDA